jgi:hypothetical protein
MADPPPYPDAGAGSDRASVAGTPRWVKVSGSIAIVVVLVFVIVHLMGGGFGRHTHGRQTPRAPTPPSTGAERGVQPP